MDELRDSAGKDGVLSLADVTRLGRQTLREGSQNDVFQNAVSELKRLWRRLHWTACSPSVTDKYLTSACNAVCVFLRRACQSQQSEIKAYFFSKQVWLQTFEIVHKAFNDNKNKPGIQVLDTLVYILHGNESIDIAKDSLKTAIAEMIDVIFTGSPAHQLKEASIVVSILLKRTQDLVPFSEYFDAVKPDYRVRLEQRCLNTGVRLECLKVSHQSILSNFLLALLLTASVSESQTAALKLFSLLCAKSEKLDCSMNVTTASRVIGSYAMANESASQTVFNNVFPSILDDKEKFINFTKNSKLSHNSSESQIATYIAILQVGRQQGFVSEEELPGMLSAGYLHERAAAVTEQAENYATFYQLLRCDAPRIRLQAFRLLTTSNTTNARVPVGSLKCLVESFRFLHDDTDAYYRDEYLSITRRFLNRLHRSNQAILRNQKLSMRQNTSTEACAEYDLFFASWLSFLRSELGPQIPYQRHILALDSLQLILPVYGANEAHDALNLDRSRRLISALLNLVFDAYDDVRAGAVSILKLFAFRSGQLVVSALSDDKILDRGQRLSACTNRADHGDAVGRLHALHVHTHCVSPRAQAVIDSKSAITELANSIGDYVRDLPKASPMSAFPLHGTILGLYHIVYQTADQKSELDSTTLDALLNVCRKIWILVKEDLCVDSPETATSEEELNGVEGPKDLLAYSWRALRDSSLLMQALLQTQAPSSALYEKIGSLCLEQLTDLRHRGAFSTVEQTFTLCCAYNRAMTDENYHALILSWTKSAFNEIENQANKLTRRSAGLPAMFAALLDPSNLQDFISTIDSLVSIASGKIDTGISNLSLLRLPQVHALNCLKDIMTHSRFRVFTETLLVDMLNLASYSLGSYIWAIRNCGLMLFRACIDRITPASSVLHGDHGIGSQAGAIRTPLEVAIHLLQRASPCNVAQGHHEGKEQQTSLNEDCEIIFAALDLLSRLSDHLGSNEVVNKLVTRQLGSKLWAIREHAALLTASLVPEGEQTQSLETRLLHVREITALNAIHGELLACRYVFTKCRPILDSKAGILKLRSLCGLLETVARDIIHHTPSPAIASAFLDLVNDVSPVMLNHNVFWNEQSSIMRVLGNIRQDRKQGSSYFLLSRAVNLHQAYVEIERKVNSKSTVDNSDIKFGANVYADQDVARFVIAELIENLSPHNLVWLKHALIDLVLTTKSPTIQTAALAGIFELPDSAWTAFGMSELTTMAKRASMIGAIDRDLWNARIALSARLIQALRRKDCCSPEVLIVSINAFKLSQKDEIETPTRSIAVKAVAEMILFMFDTYQTDMNRFDANHLYLLLLLYEFLNDDDDEIRSQAAHATFRLCSQWQDGGQNVQFCAAASREWLIRSLPDKFSSSSTLIAYACMRVIGAQHSPALDEPRQIVSCCKNTPVSTAIETLLRQASDLFAEERQNLYIDDLTEILNWADVVAQCRLDILGDKTIHALSEWTFKGLQCLESLLESQESKKGTDAQNECCANHHVTKPMGLTYDAEMLIIFVRVITMARLLKKRTKQPTTTSAEEMNHKSLIKRRLQSLDIICRQAKVHEQVLVALERSLSDL